MAFVHPDAKDAQLSEIRDNIETLHICNAEPSNYTEAATTYAIGYRNSPPVGALQDGNPDGRQFQVEETGGMVTDSDTATHWALVDDSSNRLLATHLLDLPTSVLAGKMFVIEAIVIRVPTTSGG